MKKLFKIVLLASFCLAAGGMALGGSPKNYAAVMTPHKALSGAPCDPSTPQNTGISYDADAYTVGTTDEPLTPLPMGMFRFAGSDAPAIGGWDCAGYGVSDGVGLSVGNVGAGWYTIYGRRLMGSLPRRDLPPMSCLTLATTCR